MENEPAPQNNPRLRWAIVYHRFRIWDHHEQEFVDREVESPQELQYYDGAKWLPVPTERIPKHDV